MICIPTWDKWGKDTVKLLKHLAAEGHKVTTSYLSLTCDHSRGQIPLFQESWSNSKPAENNQQKAMPFLGVCSYFRNFIPNYAVFEVPLSALIHVKGLQSHDLHGLSWQSLYWLKVELADHPHSETTWRNQTIYSDRWWEGWMHDLCSLALTQWQSAFFFVLFFYPNLTSWQLDSLAAFMHLSPPRELSWHQANLLGIMMSPCCDIIIPNNTTHAVSMILLKQKPLIFLQLNTVLLDMPNAHVKR